MNKQIVNHHTQPGQSETHEGLEYPFGLRWSPPIGEPFEVVDGVYWLRTPLPMALDHINLWLLRDGDHWTIVDTGYDHESSKAVWRQVFENFLDPKSVSRIIVTHYHPDHIGLAAWLSRQCDSEVFISRGEFATYRAMIDRDQKLFADQISAFTKELGFESEHSQRYLQFMNSEDKPAIACKKSTVFLFKPAILLVSATANGKWYTVMGIHQNTAVCFAPSWMRSFQAIRQLREFHRTSVSIRRPEMTTH